MEKNNEEFSVVIFINSVMPYCVHREKIIELLYNETDAHNIHLELNKFPNFLNYENLERFEEKACKADLVILTPINYDYANLHIHGKERVSKAEAIEAMENIICKITDGVVVEINSHIRSYQKSPAANNFLAENWSDPVIEEKIKEIINQKKKEPI